MDSKKGKQRPTYEAYIDINNLEQRTKNASTLHRHLNWEENVKHTAASCYAILTSIKKLKKILPFHIKKNLAQSLVLCKLHYNDIVYHSLPDYSSKRLQRVQKAAASFVLGRYASTEDIVLQLKWLPVKEQSEWNLLKATHKAVHNINWPNYLKFNIFQHDRCLRSSNSLQLERPLISNTLQDQASHVFNLLPEDVRNCPDLTTFCRKTRNIVYTRVLERLN